MIVERTVGGTPRNNHAALGEGTLLFGSNSDNKAMTLNACPHSMTSLLLIGYLISGMRRLRGSYVLGSTHSRQLASERLILGEQFGNPFAQLVQFRF